MAGLTAMDQSDTRSLEIMIAEDCEMMQSNGRWSRQKTIKRD